MSNINKNCVICKIWDIKVYTFSLKVKDVLKINYTARRWVDEEEWAIQRPLDSSRIEPIKDFILKWNMFLNTFILNWTNTQSLPIINWNEISFDTIEKSAQVLDWQHRLAWLEDAIKENEKIGDNEIIISMTIWLQTEEAARIFLNINYEQKPVPKSLMYDLFWLVEKDREHDIVRSGDIAKFLNNHKNSPYFELLKMPWNNSKWVIDFSSVVNSIKKYVWLNGVFYKYKITTLDKQQKIFLNYFLWIQSFYEDYKKGYWYEKNKNPFLMTAWFIWAVDFLFEILLNKCIERKSFEVNTFKELLNLDKNNLFHRDELKNVDWKYKRAMVQQYLEKNNLKDIPEENEYKF